MDHHHLQDSTGEEMKRGPRSERSHPSMRPPSATDSLRRSSTEGTDPRSPDLRNLTSPDDINNDDNFNFPTARSYSWESHSDNEDRGGGAASSSRSSSRQNQRKFDMTTPTLIDEMDEHEEEMISLQRARQRQEERGVAVRDESQQHRRTPGASMYKSSFHDDPPKQQAVSVRRNPGAHDVMHRPISTATGHGLSQEQGDESAILGFGLTLSTPVGTDSRQRSTSKEDSSWDLRSASSQSTSQINNQTAADGSGVGDISQGTRPPRAPGSGGRSLESHEHHRQEHLHHHPSQQNQDQQQQRAEFPYSSWTFQRGTGAQLGTRHGAYSPNTFRLSEDLGNLLFEEGDSTDLSGQQMFRGAAQQRPSGFGTGTSERNKASTAENWTSSYVFKTEQVGEIPSRVPKSSMGRGRRARNDSSSRRSRGHDRFMDNTSRVSDDQQRQTPSFLRYAQQPKPVRSMQMQGTSFGQPNPFFPGGFDTNPPASTSNTYAVSGDNTGQHQQPPVFNFGGAFAPLAKDTTGPSFGASAQVPASSAQPSKNIGTYSSVHHGEGYDAHPTYGEGSVPPGRFQSQSFQPLPQSAGPPSDSPFQHSFHSTTGYAGSTVSPSPTFGFAAAPPYSQHPPPGMIGPVHRLHPPPGMSETAQGQRPSAMQASAHEFYPMATEPFHQPRPAVTHFHPSGQGWPTGASSEYRAVPNQTGWPGPSPPAWSGGGDFTVPTGQTIPVPPPASPNMPYWQEQSADMPSQHSPSVFGAASPPPVEAPVALTSSPAFTLAAAPAPRRDYQAAQQSRQKGSRKNQPGRRSSGRKTERTRKGDGGSTGTGSFGTQRRGTPSNVAEERSASRASIRKKKSRGRDSQTPEVSSSVCSTPSNVPTPILGGDEGSTLHSEDPADAKRAELIESPATRSAFKDFYRKFRTEERASFQGAEFFAVQSLEDGSLPEKVHWRVYLELADLAKRSNRFADARRLYQQVCQLQPYASQGWLEYSKLEEECGHLSRGAKILHAGLEYCEYSENLLTRAIKHEEKMGNLTRARELLARLKHVGIEKVWRTVLEGALLEARAGNVVMARRVLKYLMHHVPWYGPLYLEAYRLERDLGRTSEALEVVERGLNAIPRYGPLWFGAFRLCEEIDISNEEYGLPRTMAMIDRAASSISKELIWKVHLDAAQMLERSAIHQLSMLDNSEEVTEATKRHYEGTLTHCRRRFCLTILNCPPNLRWKVWLAAGRMEMAVGNTDTARSLLLRGHQVVPEKGRATTLLECARLEEFNGDTELAHAILCKSRVEYASDWKVWLESVLLEIRSGRQMRAIQLAKGALEIHPGTGRLWAALVQLRFLEGGEEAQFYTLRRALNAVPKSGEVWCEGGRIHLNPFSRSFNLERARRHLYFATKFTPQYGDSFLESLRMELVEQWLAPIASVVWENTKSSFLLKSTNVDIRKNLMDYVFSIFTELSGLFDDSANKNTDKYDSTTELGTKLLNEQTTSVMIEQLDSAYRDSVVNLDDLELRCANADPNYGLLWFHCRHGATDTARRILDRAKVKVFAEVKRFAHIYVVAMVRQSAVMGMMAREREGEDGTANSVSFPSIDDEAAWELLVDEKLLAAPSLHDILYEIEKTRGEGRALLESVPARSTFATGLAELSKHQPIGELSLNERRKALFGTDALFS